MVAGLRERRVLYNYIKMADLNGIQQAILLLLEAEGTGEALDVNRQPVSKSGRRQAAYLLEGVPNPDPARFEIVGFFTKGQEVQGVKTTRYAPGECPPGSEAQWILATGFWDSSAQWVGEGIWNY